MSLINEALKKAERERFGAQVPHHRHVSPALELAQGAEAARRSTGVGSNSWMIVLLLLISCCLGALLAYLFSLRSESSSSAGPELVIPSSDQSTPEEAVIGRSSIASLPGVEGSIDPGEGIEEGSGLPSQGQLPDPVLDSETPRKPIPVSPEIARFLAERIRIQMVIPSSQRLLVLSDDGVTNVTIRSGELVPAPYLVYFTKIDGSVIVFTDGMGGEYRKSF
jgi:hypothetical protein